MTSGFVLYWINLRGRRDEELTKVFAVTLTDGRIWVVRLFSNLFICWYFLCRLAPKSTEDLEEFVENFFVGFPCTTAICISLLGGPYAYFLQELLDNPLYVRAWMLVSRLDSESHPIVLLLPVDSISEGIFLTHTSCLKFSVLSRYT